MQIELSPDDIETIIREADAAARRLRRKLCLPVCEREDLGQDLLVDLLRRLPAYDPARGSIGAFATSSCATSPRGSPSAITVSAVRRVGRCSRSRCRWPEPASRSATR